MNTPRVFIIMLQWIKPGADAALAQFRQSVAPLLEKHDVRTERVVAVSGKGQLVGVNGHEPPTVIQVLSVPSLAAFQAYVADPEVQRLAPARDAALHRMTAVLGSPRDVSELNPRGTSPETARAYGVAFVSFQEGGADGLLEFNRRAANLFVRHGMHVENLIDVSKVMTPVGTALTAFEPERVVVFFLDDPAALPRYAADPEYKELAPIRDRGLRSYDFFIGKVPPKPSAEAGRD